MDIFEKGEMLLAQSCSTICDPEDCSLPGSSVHRIFQTRILEWVAISFSRGSTQPRDRTHVSWVSYTGRWTLYHSTTWAVLINVCHTHGWLTSTVNPKLRSWCIPITCLPQTGVLKPISCQSLSLMPTNPTVKGNLRKTPSLTNDHTFKQHLVLAES